MKPILLLPLLLCAAFAAPTKEEQKPLETTEVEQNEETHGAEVPAARFNFCPDGWFAYGTRCFRFVSSPMTWYKAEAVEATCYNGVFPFHCCLCSCSGTQEHCNGLGGQLASATNPREYSFLQQMTQTAGQSIAWLGGFNLQGQWMWIDREGFYYTNWYSQSAASSYPCLYLSTAYGWRNTLCSSTYRFICSKNAFGC